MLISGFTFIRNWKKYDFPFQECVESMLPIVDELVINVGKSDDGTEDEIARVFKSPKIKLVHSVWDDSKVRDGVILSEQTNIALDACQGRWCLYLQGDEAIHEGEHRLIREAIEAEDRKPNPVDGFRFRYFHFFGGYSLVQRPWNWYPSEIRVIRRASGARSFGDAQTFHVPGVAARKRRGDEPDDRGLKTRLIDAHIFHYGHARAPETMAAKINYFHRFWHGDNHGIQVNAGYNLNLKDLQWYWWSHPKAYERRVAAGQAWSPVPSKAVPRFGRVVVFYPKAQARLAQELKTTLESAASVGKFPAGEIILAGSVREQIRAVWRQLVSRTPATAVDLGAEGKTVIGAISAYKLGLAGFAWRVAHAPSGTLSRLKARAYSAVSWGRHEKTKLGFIVPESEYARELARWVGADI